MKTKSLDSPGGVHVGKGDLDVGTVEQVARLRRLRDAREDSGPSQEVRFRAPGSVVRRSPSPLIQVARIRRAHSNVRSERGWPQHAESPSGEER